MAIGAEVEAALTAKFESLFPHLDERQRRLALGAEARVLGHGGIRAVARASGVSAVTVSKGAADHIAAGQPMISVDTKKKELVGLFKNDGQHWRPAGDPVRVNVHDFPDPDLGKANPYGVYDVANDDGGMSVGTDHDTAAFALETVRRWFHQVGAQAYPGTSKLLVCADGGGFNGYRLRAWKTGLAALAGQTGLAITVCHLPPGTSKWNKIEHRLFSHISMNWVSR